MIIDESPPACTVASSSGLRFFMERRWHIVPPTGAKEMNLAAADAVVLTRALKAFCETGERGLAGRLFIDLPAPLLESAAVFLVDDDAAAPAAGRNSVPRYIRASSPTSITSPVRAP
jgi:hypothetical protein